MPRYQYVCTGCEHRFEKQQSINEPALSKCPECGDELRKEFGVGGIAFKGTGFYRTDSAKPTSSGSSTES